MTEGGSKLRTVHKHDRDKPTALLFGDEGLVGACCAEALRVEQPIEVLTGRDVERFHGRGATCSCGERLLDEGGIPVEPLEKEVEL